MARFAAAVAILSVIGYGMVWANPMLAYRVVTQDSFPDLPTTLTANQNILLFLTGAVPTLLFAAVLWAAKRFFDCYRDGQLFPHAAGTRLKAIGRLCLILAVVNPIVRTISMLVISWLNPPGQKQLVLSLSSTDGFLLVFSGLLYMIGTILAEAVQVAEDNRMIV
ncbi:MAG: DUF2975 domain-containing protein [Alphaproteobacteria bacterium]|nr:DUF2975 domain-containing protein [Alphaproteobacteria bacterium]